MAATFRALNLPTGTWTADVFAAANLAAATDTGVSLSQSAAGIVTGSVSRTGLHMVRLFRGGVRYGELWGNLVDGATVDLEDSKQLAAAGLDGYIPVVGSEMGINSTAAAKVADTTLRRNMDNVEASANGDTLDVNSLYGSTQQMQKSSVSSGTLTIEKTDGTTLGTLTVTSDASAEPVTGVGT